MRGLAMHWFGLVVDLVIAGYYFLYFTGRASISELFQGAAVADAVFFAGFIFSHDAGRMFAAV